MEPRKYSTGTKGRIKKHSDECKEFIQTHSPNFSLAKEFIASIDPDYDETIWQRYQTPDDILPELQEWLGDEKPLPPKLEKTPPIIVRHPQIKSASHLAADAALAKTRAWISESAATLASLSAAEIAESTALTFYKELTNPVPAK